MNNTASEEKDGDLADVWGAFGSTHVPYRVLLLSKMIDRLTTRHLRTVADLSLAEWRVLAHLAVMGDTSASRLSKVALTDRAEISRAVRLLTEKDLIHRVADPNDKRIALLGMTEAGGNVFRTTQKARLGFFKALTEELGLSELKQLDDYLFRIAKVADRMLAEGGYSGTGAPPKESEGSQ